MHPAFDKLQGHRGVGGSAREAQRRQWAGNPTEQAFAAATAVVGEPHIEFRVVPFLCQCMQCLPCIAAAGGRRGQRSEPLSPQASNTGMRLLLAPTGSNHGVTALTSTPYRPSALRQQKRRACKGWGRACAASASPRNPARVQLLCLLWLAQACNRLIYMIVFMRPPSLPQPHPDSSSLALLGQNVVYAHDLGGLGETGLAPVKWRRHHIPQRVVAAPLCRCERQESVGERVYSERLGSRECLHCTHPASRQPTRCPDWLLPSCQAPVHLGGPCGERTCNGL